MKPEELRIGNRLRNKKVMQSTFIVKGIINSVAFFGGQPGYDNDDFDPYYEDVEGIPLTEEWFGKLGGVYDENKDKTNPIHKNDLTVMRIYAGNVTIKYFRHGNYVDTFCSDGGDYSNPLSYQLQFVHELQNLYYTLTKEELEVKIL